MLGIETSSEDDAASFVVGFADIITRGGAFSAHVILAFLLLLLVLTLFCTTCKGILGTKFIFRSSAIIISRLINDA